MQSQINIQGLIQPILSGGKKIGPLVIANPNADIGSITTIEIATGSVTIAVPLGAIAALIVPSTTNAATISFKTSLNSGDTGLPISPDLPTLLTFPTTIPTTMLFTMGAGGTGIIEVNFI